MHFSTKSSIFSLISNFMPQNYLFPRQITNAYCIRILSVLLKPVGVSRICLTFLPNFRNKCPKLYVVPRQCKLHVMYYCTVQCTVAPYNYKNLKFFRLIFYEKICLSFLKAQWCILYDMWGFSALLHTSKNTVISKDWNCLGGTTSVNLNFSPVAVYVCKHS